MLQNRPNTPHLHLKTVLCAPRGARHHSSVEDEQIQAGQGGSQRICGRFDAGQIRQVQLLHGDLALRRRGMAVSEKNVKTTLQGLGREAAGRCPSSRPAAHVRRK